jgi:hypothetical protein
MLTPPRAETPLTRFGNNTNRRTLPVPPHSILRRIVARNQAESHTVQAFSPRPYPRRDVYKKSWRHTQSNSSAIASVDRQYRPRIACTSQAPTENVAFPPCVPEKAQEQLLISASWPWPCRSSRPAPPAIRLPNKVASVPGPCAVGSRPSARLAHHRPKAKRSPSTSTVCGFEGWVFWAWPGCLPSNA